MSKPTLDEAVDVRKGEELPLERLQPYLEAQLSDWVGPVDYHQFPSGFSNLTYLLKAGDRELVLRRPPFGASARGGHDMFREYRVQRDLKSVFDKVPAVYHYCEDEAVIGAPFYLMERVKGVILRRPGADSVPLTAKEYERLAESWLDTLVELHQLDYQATDLADLGRPEGYATRQVQGWTKRYLKAKTAEMPEASKLMDWLNSHIPTDGKATIVHNDYKYDNLVYAPDDWKEVRAVLDWEMTTVGDPWMDLGTSLAYWINPSDPPEERPSAMLPTYFEGNPSRGAILEAYAKKTGQTMPDVVFYYAFGLFKVAVIGQQIFYRYKAGLTQDVRFAKLDQLVRFCCIKALQAVDRQRVDELF